MSERSPDVLSLFSDPARSWFEGAFESPTPAQAQAWPAIAEGKHVLLCAPTGSGKTLAAFLWAIDRLARSDGGRQPEAQVNGRTGARLLYVSPLKALSYDIERNLRVPLKGVGANLTVAIRTGDTSQRERASIARKPPDILITTPESLYLLLTSKAAEILGSVQTVIIDEIHALASTKRGAHLALTLERLEALVGSQPGRAPGSGRPIQRIGLSATQRPLAEVAAFLTGPSRPCEIIDVGMRKQLDLRIEVPVESMRHPDALPLAPLLGAEGSHLRGDLAGAEQLAPPQRDQAADPLQPVQGGEALRGSIWPAIYPRLLELVQEHSSTIVFVNSRRTAERVALRLNELAGRAQGSDDPHEIARAHHGSLSSEERNAAEELLKSGQLPCLVATSSLELGIDMGAVDLVVQVSSPKSVASGLQRIGRAGHAFGEPSKGRIFPRYRGDLLECAVLVRRMREGEIESTVVPRNPLDVLAQQIVATAAIEGEVSVRELHRRARLTYTYSELTMQQLENVLDMLDGRYPSSEIAELAPRIVWDRVRGLITPRRGAQRLAVLSAGTIPDRGLYLVTLPDGRRVGELDEEMVYEARPGQTFLLGASTWRIEEIGRDRVIVTPAPGVPGAVPFWRGDGIGRPRELGEAIGAFSRWAVDQSAQTLADGYDLDPNAASNLLELLHEQREATGVLPSDRTIVVERFRDEIGDWRLCVLCPLGGAINSAWALALSARIRAELGIEADAIASDDGIVVRLPDADEPPDAELALIDPEELEDLVIGELGGSALFGARFRECAARSLLITRAMPGRRTPLWQQRLKAQSLLEVVRAFPDFPILLETYRECLADVLDIAGLRGLLADLQRREVGFVEVETPSASPFAASLLFDFLATYMYEGDAPNAERRAAALSLDRDMLAELLGQEELRDLIDAGALAEVEAHLQARSPAGRARDQDELHDLLRRIGDLTLAELEDRCVPELDVPGALRSLRRARRAVPIRIASEQRFIDAADAGLYRDALGAVPPAGLPSAFLLETPEALVRIMRRYSSCNGPFTSEAAARRYQLGKAVVEDALKALEAAGEVLRGELRPGGVPGEREWCGAAVLRRLRRSSLAVLRREIEPVDERAFAAFHPSWQGADRHFAAGAGVQRLRELLIPLQGLPLTPSTWEHDVLPRRIGSYSPTWMDALCGSGEVVWVGAGTAGRSSGRVALYFREDVGAIGPPPGRLEAPSGALHQAILSRLALGASFLLDLEEDLGVGTRAELQEALWDLVWAGSITNDSFAPLRMKARSLAALPATPERRRRSGSRFSTRRAGASPAHLAGRWSLTAPLFEDGRTQSGDPALAAAEARRRRRVTAELLLERYGVLTREHVLAEGIEGGFAALYEELSALETLGVARRGYFVEGLGGAQFALPGAVERLRGLRLDDAQEDREHAIVLAATDPAQPYGAALRWPASARRQGRAPARVPGAYVVLVDWTPALYLERGGRSLITLASGPESHAEARLAPIDLPAPLLVGLAALANAARLGQVGRLAIERVDGEPVLGSRFEQALLSHGFSAGPRRLTLRASA